MEVLNQSMCIFEACPSSLRRVRAEYKDKSPDMSGSHRNIGTPCNSKLKYPKLKDTCIESTEKLVEDERMHVNTAILKL